MTNHYYTQNPDVVHEECHWPFTLLGNELLFTTDNGVFSKSRVDYGSCALLNAFEADQTPAGPWLDLGCGYGPIGLALAKRWPDWQVTMADVNELALSLAQQNATANQITNVTIVESDRYAALGTQRYAAILTNPPVRAGKAVVTSMLTEAAQHLLPGGTLTVVLQKKQGAPSAKKTMTATFGNCQILKKDKGYYILESRQNASS